MSANCGDNWKDSSVIRMDPGVFKITTDIHHYVSEKSTDYSDLLLSVFSCGCGLAASA
jgi:hypothetical protein